MDWFLIDSFLLVLRILQMKGFFPKEIGPLE